MDNVIVKKVRETTTHRNCAVTTTHRFDPKQNFLIEDIELSCPAMTLESVAFSADRVFERLAR